MDNDYFSNGGIQPPFHFDPKTPLNSLHSPPQPNSDYFLNTHFDSELISIVSSPNTVDSSSSLCELIGKLGSICSSPLAPFTNSSSNNMTDSTRTSCYTTPMNSPPKLMNQMGKDRLPNLGDSVLLNSPPISGAKFSRFGSRSFNGRTSQFELNNEESRYGSGAGVVGRGNLTRILSSPSLVQNMMCERLNLSKISGHNEECSVSEQDPSGEMGSKTRNVLNLRKRKAVKSKNFVPIVDETEDGRGKRRAKSTEGNGSVKTEEQKGSENEEAEKEEMENQKIAEPPKDYIHVRARRGQATDSHSLAERVRREKISQRMKLLQDLVPGCNKVTGKALMLDEIINYVQSLQRQVEFLSMKLASVNPRMDVHIDNLLHKEICQPNVSLHQHVYPADGYGENLTQLPTVCEDDLQSIVQMGFIQNSNQDLMLQSQTFPVPNSDSHMKIEM